MKARSKRNTVRRWSARAVKHGGRMQDGEKRTEEEQS